MTTDERITQVTAEMNALQEQAAAIDQQSAQLQQKRGAVVDLYRRAEGALAVLQQIKADEAEADKAAPAEGTE